MSEADGSAYANINFIDPVFAAWKMLELGMICLPVIFCGDDIYIYNVQYIYMIWDRDVMVCLKMRIILQSPIYDRFNRENAAYLIRWEAADFHHMFLL